MTAKNSRLTVPVGEHDHVQGPAAAPVTLVEYGDYECPHCGRAYPIVKRLQERLPDGDQVISAAFPHRIVNRTHDRARGPVKVRGLQLTPPHPTVKDSSCALMLMLQPCFS